MNGQFFVILNRQNGSICAMTDGCENLAIFQSEDAAKKAGHLNPLGDHFGFEVFESGAGNCSG